MTCKKMRRPPPFVYIRNVQSFLLSAVATPYFPTPHVKRISCAYKRNFSIRRKRLLTVLPRAKQPSPYELERLSLTVSALCTLYEMS
ncbi:hypothetical protein BDR06DRAFT_418247 [Suillus hirtellus]|nr:hypothetical protein BDR06DRAFT_418247 [Suillus hirtellus]